MKRRGFCLVVTGGIACGKSTVCGFFRRWGAEIWDADDEAHALLGPHGAAVKRILRTFGSRVAGSDGGIDRRRLGGLVFADGNALARLDAITHPAILRAGRRFAAGVRRRGAAGAAAIPLFFECGMGVGRAWPAVLCLSATRDTMLRRLLERGLDEDQALARIASQWPVSEKAALSTDVIENDGSLAELEARAREIFVRHFGPPRQNPAPSATGQVQL